MLHLIALGFLAAIVRDPRLLGELERDAAPVWSNSPETIPTALSKIEAPSSYAPQHVGQPRDHSLIYRKLILFSDRDIPRLFAGSRPSRLLL